MTADHRIVTRHKPPAATLPFGLDTDVPIDPDPLDPHPEHPTPIELVVRLIKGASRFPWTADYDPESKSALFDAVEEDNALAIDLDPEQP